MKSAIVAAVAIALLTVLASTRKAQAYPGQMCMNTSTCGHCEICIKEHSYDPTGKCLPVAGCY
jgi:hypothetical protein